MGAGEAPPGGGPSGGAGITFGTFKEWTKTCGVRKVQREYEKMAEEAREQGKTATQEMQARGYKDYAAFSKACPEFPVTCWPIEFAELGSGFVLYFHFLAMLGFLFLLLFLLQTPAMYFYSQENWLQGWQHNDWTMSYATSRQCGCLGKNDGITGPKDAGSRQLFSDPSYGTRCAAWDMRSDVCNSTRCDFQSPGGWICKQWCFISSHCSPAPDEVNGALTDRRYRGLVKSYTACKQSDSPQAQCAGMSNTMFNEPGVETDSKEDNFVGTFWLTPGNYGPEQAQSSVIPTMYLACVAVICALIFLEYQKMMLIDRQVDSGTISPNNFAALVRGLPATATDAKAIAQFFKENAVFGKTDTEIVKVVIGWDAQEFTDMRREIMELRKQKARLPDDDPKQGEMQKRIDDIQHDFATCATEKAARLRSSGVVVVIFRYQSDLRACLMRWTSFWARWFYSDATDACCLPKGNRFWKSGELPRFPIGTPPRPVHKIQVEQAPNPGDINWMELGVPHEKRVRMFMKTNAIMFLLVCISFGICYGLNKVQELFEGQGGASDALAILPALGVGFMNAVLTICARRLGDKEYHDTITVQEFSQALKMSIGMIVNTAGVMYVINAQPSEWYKHGGLITDAFTMLLLNSLLPPLVPYIDIGYRLRKVVRRQLTQEKIDHMNTVARQKPTTPEEVEALQKVRVDIQKFKKAHAPSPMNETRRYALALKTSVCCLFYMPVMPWIALVGALGIFLQYWVDKYLLLRWYHRPAKPASAAMALFSLKFLKFVAPLGVTVTTWLFLIPSWEAKQEVYYHFFVCLAISVIFSFVVPLSIWTRAFFGMCGGKLDPITTEQDYYKAQYIWSREMKYHKDHFLLKPLPESQNPEFLKPGEETATEMEAVKASYGVAAAQVAADAGTDDPMRLKGGKVVSSAEDGGASKPLAPSPTTYGVTAASRDEEAPPASEPESPPPAAAESGVSAVAPPAGHEHALWEFEAGHSWKRFEDDCHDFIEGQYQKFRAGKGKEQIEVKTGGKKLSLNFKKMTQKMAGSHHIRGVRRRAGTE